jgi:hypothetical protein
MSPEMESITAFGMIAVGWIVTLEVRLRDVQNQLLRSKEKLVDEGIVKTVSSMPDAALDAALSKDLSKRAD